MLSRYLNKYLSTWTAIWLVILMGVSLLTMSREAIMLLGPWIMMLMLTAGGVVLYNHKLLEDSLAKKSKELEDNKRETSELLDRFRAILESTEEPLVAINPEGKIIIFNHAASALTGYDGREIIKKSYEKYLHLMDNDFKSISKTVSPLQQALKEQKTVLIRPDENYYILNKNGKTIPVTLACSPVVSSDDLLIGAVCVFHNIEDKKKLSELQNEFVFMAAHELSNPVSAISGYVEAALEANPKSKKVKNALNVINDASTRLKRTIQNLLQIVRFDSGQLQVKPGEVEVDGLIDELIKLKRKQIKGKAIKIKFANRKKAKILAFADKDLLIEVFDNLLSNAIKYTNKGFISVDYKYSKTKNSKKYFQIEKDLHSKYIVFDISDTGCGIPKADQKKIFGKFFRGSNIDRGIEGNGLGLFIVKQLVKKMDGEIWFASNQNGTTFSFSLPLYK